MVLLGCVELACSSVKPTGSAHGTGGSVIVAGADTDRDADGGDNATIAGSANTVSDADAHGNTAVAGGANADVDPSAGGRATIADGVNAGSSAGGTVAAAGSFGSDGDGLDGMGGAAGQGAQGGGASSGGAQGSAAGQSGASTSTGPGNNLVCDDAGTCTVCVSDYACGPSCTTCGGSKRKCLDLGGASRCVGCLSNADCVGATPVCSTVTNTCIARRSCSGLAKTCGPTHDADCCAANLVPGIAEASFYRGYDGNAYTDKGYPARVSDFVMDTYEVTVGRFRKFVDAYSPGMIANGAGKNANNPEDTGWDAANWNQFLPKSAGALKAAIRCHADYQTWTDAPEESRGENRPINCINWYEAQAFCIWDGGRLPTQAEWNYAAAGGTEQRRYPWGWFDPPSDAAVASYDCHYPKPTMNGCSSYINIAPVGSLSGNGRWGHAELAGNVWEWAQDVFRDDYPMPCNNCANLATSGNRTLLSGGFNWILVCLLSSGRTSAAAGYRDFVTGIRCARAR